MYSMDWYTYPTLDVLKIIFQEYLFSRRQISRKTQKLDVTKILCIKVTRIINVCRVTHGG